VSLYASTDGDPILSALLYPLGFVYIIIGGYQLYTEQTLPPVALTLERLASIPALLRNWTMVLIGNFTGGALGAAALAFGGVLSPEAATAAASIAEKGIETGWWPLFSKAAFAGLIVAGVVWVEYAARDTISRLVVVYIAFLSIPLGGLFHSVVSFTEMIYLVFLGDLSPVVGMSEFVLPVLLGNTLGGVVLVTAVNYFQTTEQRLESARFEGSDRQLSLREWVLGDLDGRSYVPLVDTAERIAAEEDGPYRIVVPISNPRTETRLVELACQLASDREDAVVEVVHVVQKPARTYGVGQSQRIVDESEALLAEVGESVGDYDVEWRTSTVVTHRSFEEVFGIAHRKRADLVVMGWGEDRLWDAARADRPIGELTNQLPCDFLVLRDRDLDPSRVLLPVADSPNAELSAEVARALRATVGADVSLLHVVDGPAEREAGERFLADWAADQDLDDVPRTVYDAADIETVLEREAADRTLLLVGATERGLLSRLVRGSLHYDIVEKVDCSVLLAERPTARSIRERLFGRR
jgi:formate/nitrite transporter FocA (FNT family)/nucleotide-binding universal stress UspA family protein